MKTTEKHQLLFPLNLPENCGFLIILVGIEVNVFSCFQGGIESNQWHEIDQYQKYFLFHPENIYGLEVLSSI